MYSIKHLNITDEPTNTIDIVEVQNIVEKFHKIIKQGKKPKKKLVDELLKCINKFPHFPQLYDHLYNIYILSDRKENADDLLELMIEKFPDYLFAKVRVCKGFIDANDIEMAEKTLNYAQNINELMPNREVFHHSEVVAFYSTRFFIEIAKKDLYQAETLMYIVESIDEEKYLSLRRIFFDTNTAIYHDNNKYLKDNPYMLVSETATISETLSLQNAALKQLTTDNYITNDVLKNILTLERSSLVSDLILLLKDTINNYPFYLKNNIYNTVIYVMELLKEMEAEESLEAILEFLKCDEKFFDFWFGDNFLEFIWQVIYKIGKNKLDILQEFLKLPSIYIFSKEQVLLALCKLHIHFPEKQVEIETIFDNLLDYYGSETLPKACNDMGYFAFFAGYVYEINETFLPKIKTLYQQNKIDLSLYGPFQEFLEENNHGHFDSYEIEDIYKINIFLNDFEHDDEEDYYEYESKESIKEQIIKNLTQQNNFQNIGRNDPCPCGSGKKYKKCCLSNT